MISSLIQPVKHLPRSRVRSSEPVRPTPFHPFQNTIESSPQHWYVFGEQHQIEREHPQPEQGKDAQKAADDQQNTDADPQPALGRDGVTTAQSTASFSATARLIARAAAPVAPPDA